MAKSKKKPAKSGKQAAAPIDENHPVIAERVSDTAKYWARKSLVLEQEADGSRGFDRVRLLSEARQMVKLALAADQSSIDGEVAKAIKALQSRKSTRSEARDLQ